LPSVPVREAWRVRELEPAPLSVAAVPESLQPVVAVPVLPLAARQPALLQAAAPTDA
jgi:hypothetical protein